MIGHGSAMIAIGIFLASVFCMLSCPADERVGIPTETSEILLNGQVSKWEAVQLRRTRDNDGTVAYRWEHREYSRDRRGQGSYMSNASCLLNLYSKLGEKVDTKKVEVISERPGRLELKFTFEGDGEGSTLHILASGSDDDTSVTFKGKGPLFDKFIKEIDAIKANADNPENDIFWSILIHPIAREKD